nr:long chain fatty acid-CoA synthetase [Mycolicibacterium sp.]
MPLQPTLRRAQSLRSTRRQRIAPRMSFPTVGQSFDIEVSRDLDGWTIRIPEIDAVTHARRRSAVELVARECIAASTGIPLGYVAIFVTNELG